MADRVDSGTPGADKVSIDVNRDAGAEKIRRPAAVASRSFSFRLPDSAPRHTAMPPKPSPHSAGKPSKRRASDASGLQQSDLRDAFGASPKHARRGSLSSEDPLEVQVTPRQYDAFTVKFLETEGTARGFSAADREEDSRRSGEARERRRRFAKRQADEPSLGSSGRRGGRAIFKSRVFLRFPYGSQPALDAFADLIESTPRHDVVSFAFLT